MNRSEKRAIKFSKAFSVNRDWWQPPHMPQGLEREMKNAIDDDLNRQWQYPFHSDEWHAEGEREDIRFAERLNPDACNRYDFFWGL